MQKAKQLSLLFSNRIVHTTRHIIKKGDLQKMHTHDFAEVFWVVEGSCQHVVNGVNSIFGENEIVLLYPSDEHELKNDFEIPFVYDLVCFPAFILTSFQDRYFPEQIPFWGGDNCLQRKILITEQQRISFSSAARCLVQNSNNRMILDRFLINLSYELGMYDTRQSKDIPEWLNSAILQLRDIKYAQCGGRILEELTGRSFGHISRILKKSMNTTPSAVVNKERLEYARSQLVLSEKQIISISLESGFKSLSQFYTSFKKLFGISPAAYRNRNRDLFFSD